MSLILEALKKLDREKQVPDRGVVIMGPTAWPSAREGLSSVRGAGLVLAALVLGGAVGALWLLRSARSAAAPPAGARAETAAAPVPVPPASGAQPPIAAPMTAPSAARPVVEPPRATAARPRVRPAPAAAPEAGTEPSPEEGDATTAEPEQVEAAPPEPEPEEAPASKAGRKSAAPDFQLQAISAQNGHPVAMLNDRLVKEGDTFGNVRVLRIGTDEVELEVSGHRRIVKF